MPFTEGKGAKPSSAPPLVPASGLRRLYLHDVVAHLLLLVGVSADPEGWFVLDGSCHKSPCHAQHAAVDVTHCALLATAVCITDLDPAPLRNTPALWKDHALESAGFHTGAGLTSNPRVRAVPPTAVVLLDVRPSRSHAPLVRRVACDTSTCPFGGLVPLSPCSLPVGRHLSCAIPDPRCRRAPQSTSFLCV